MTCLERFLVTVFSLTLFIADIHSKISCKDHDNNDIDWFIMYKLPQIHGSPYEFVTEGYGYFYMDVNNMQWQMGKMSLNQTKHALYYTLQQAYDNPKSKDQTFMFYNDETPEKHVSESHGHTKGVVNFDKESGYWLVHSLPRFPDYVSYAWPPSGREYGQTFLCMSMPYSQFDVIGKQFLYTYPQIYHFNFPETFAADNPNMAMAVNKKHVEKAPWNNMAQLSSSAGQKFLSFAKFTDYYADIYDAWLAPYFQSIMFTETWQNGRGKTHSNCSATYKVENVQFMNISNVGFKETKDHSKWGVTSAKTWICIGGINRMDEQKKRAGGMVCANIPKVWTAFNESISIIETCPPKLTSSKYLSPVNIIQLK